MQCMYVQVCIQYGIYNFLNSIIIYGIKYYLCTYMKTVLVLMYDDDNMCA